MDPLVKNMASSWPQLQQLELQFSPWGMAEQATRTTIYGLLPLAECSHLTSLSINIEDHYLWPATTCRVFPFDIPVDQHRGPLFMACYPLQSVPILTSLSINIEDHYLWPATTCRVFPFNIPVDQHRGHTYSNSSQRLC